MTITNLTPKETDRALAAVWHKVADANTRLGYNTSWMLGQAGAKYYYRGRQRVTDMTAAEAVAVVEAAVAEIAEYQATHNVVESDGWERTDWSEYTGRVRPYDADKLPTYLAQRVELTAERDGLLAEARALEDTYTGWSRFFLVTSSAGHVHSSTHCSTCRPTTAFGWLPELSDTSEADAVAELGPTLCSVCFPSAPVEWTTGKKLTAAQAARKAA